jgi:hypothetical protein
MAFDLSAWTTAKYRYSFVGDEGTSYIAEIHEDGFSGSVATVDIVGRGSINTRWATEGDDEFAPMMTSETSLALYDTGEALASDLIDALDTVDNKYLMVIRQSGNLKWVGRIDPESINFDEDGQVKLSVTATDGLGRLENKPYITNTDGSGVDEGSATLVSVIADVLSSTGFGLNFYISSSLVPRAATAINETKNPLEYVWVNKIAFTSNRDKEERGLVSKLSVLEAICKAWGLRVFQSEGAWHLIQVSHFAQNSHRKWQYNSAGSLQGYSDVDPRVTVSNEDIKRSESTANILPGYKSSIVQYQHGPIRLLRSPQFEPLTISNAEAILGGNYPWSQYADVPGQIGAAEIYTLDDGTWGMGVDEINVAGGLSDKTGYDGVEIDGKGIIFANIPHSTLTTYIGNGFSAQTTDPIPDGVPLKFAASIFGLQFGNNPNPNPHLVADEWVAFQIEHAGTTTRYLKFSEDGSLEWSTTNNWCLIRNGLQPNGWASLSLDDIDNTVNNGAMTVRIGPVIYDDTDEALWQKVVWDNVQLFPELPDGQSNYDATSVVSYINNAARSEPRHVQRVVILGDGPSTYNKGSMYTNSALTTRTADWEITTTGHSGANTDVSHAEALGELMLRCMHKIRRKHNASYVGYGGILTPLNVLNRSSALWAPWEITVTWQGEYSQGSWYRAEYTSSLTNLETETGIATGAHLLSSFGRGTSSNAGFTYNRIGSSFDTLVARENDRISKVVADPVSGATVINSNKTVHCEALTDPEGTTIALRHNDSVYFQSVKTGRIIKRLVDASENDPEYSPYVAGAITFKVTEAFTTDEYIEENDPILPGTITGMRIDMDGVSIINTHIKSDGEYAWNGEIDELTGEITAPGDTGWVVSKSGGAVFNDVIVRGNIEVGDLLIGKDVGYLSGTPSERIAGEHGIWINGDNYWILDTNADPDEEFFRVGDDNSHINWDGTTGSEAFTIKSQGSIVFDSSSGSGGLGLTGKVQISATGSITDGTNYELGPDGLDFQLPSGPSAATELRWLETLGSTSAGDITLGAWSASPTGRVIEADADTFRLYTNGTLNTATGDGIWADSARYHGEGIVFGGSASEIVGSSAGLYLKSTSLSTSFLWPGNPGNNGDVLTSNGSGGLTFSPASGVSSLNGLSDVNITSATTGDLLRYNGSSWVDYPDSNYAAASHTHAATDITSGTLASARLSGSYTGITGVGALSAGSITSGFGSIATANTISTTSKIYVGGSTYASDGIQLDYNAGNPRFYVGDGANSYFEFNGATAKLNGGLVTNIASGSDIGIQGWSSDIIFSASDVDTVSWTTGTIKLADGTTYSSIGSGNTGNMTALTYIYFDSASPTALATTTTAANAIGTGKILIAVAQKNTDTGATEAVFQAFGGRGGQLLNAASIAANSITANEIAANTITAAQIVAGTITATELASNSVTATKINVANLSAVNTSTGSLSVTGDLTMNSYAGSEWASAKITSAGDIYANDGYFESLTAASSGLTVYSSTLGPASGTLAYANGVFTVDGDNVISEASIGNGLSYSSFTLTTDISATSGGGGGVSNGDLLTLTDKNGNTVLVKCEIV